jgi:nicotinamide mononucleotide transporter
MLITFDAFLNYFIYNWIEIAGVALSLIYLYLSIQQKVSLWIFGFFTSALYIIVFWEAKFYADMSLQMYYLVVSIYGWINWHKGNEKNELAISTITKRQFFNLSVMSLCGFAMYYIVLKNFTDSPIPFSDFIVGALSVTATWMLARKILENWIVWIVADALAIFLFVYRGLYPTAILFMIYTAMAAVGYFQWKNSMKKM